MMTSVPLLLLIAGSLGAASPPGEIEQLSPVGREPIAPAQVASARDDLAAQADEAQVHAGASASAEPPTQISTSGGPVGPQQQLASDKRNVEPPSPLSAVEQGRRPQTEALAGRDRCDPASPGNAAPCARVIETRSAEFEHPQTEPLTPEQRLLVTEQLRRPIGGSQAAARRLGRGAGDPDAIEDQGIAAAALSGRQGSQPGAEPQAMAEDSVNALAIINAPGAPKE